MSTPGACRVCGSTAGVRLYLPGLSCPAHTPAAEAGRPEPTGQYPEPFPGAQTYRYRANDSAPIDQRARKSGKRANRQQRAGARE